MSVAEEVRRWVEVEVEKRVAGAAAEVLRLRKQVDELRDQLAGRMTRIERLKKELRAKEWRPLEPGHNLPEQLAAALERTALEAQRADLLHAALNRITTQRAHQGWHDEDADREAEEALKLSRSRRSALFVGCSCGQAFGLEEWVELRALGLQEQAGLPGDPLELRLCVNCGTTLALPLRRLPVTK